MQVETPRLPATKASLLELAPVRAALDDPGVKLCVRRADERWAYEAGHKTSLGFNPMRGEIFIGPNGALADFLAAPDDASLRGLNEGGYLMPEVMMLAHDYMHVWATSVIRELWPGLGFGEATLSRENIDRHVGALLLTEAVATVAVDYWYLSQREIDRELDLGSDFSTVTVSYHRGDDDEYRRFNPELDVASPAFFTSLAKFYFTGAFPGFDVRDVKRSPKVYRWIRHELVYGQLQRRYSREWLMHLLGEPAYERGELTAPLSPEPFERLIPALGERLWSKVQDPTSDRVRHLPPPEATWRAPDLGPIDFRFTNLDALPEGASDRRGIADRGFDCWAHQRLRQRAFPDDDNAVFAVEAALKTGSVPLIEWIADQLPHFEPPRASDASEAPHTTAGPVDLFCLP